MDNHSKRDCEDKHDIILNIIKTVLIISINLYEHLIVFKSYKYKLIPYIMWLIAAAINTHGILLWLLILLF